MSMWTYIHGTIDVTPMGSTQPEKRYILETVLAHLPRVEGSEGDMNVYVVQPEGHDSSCSCDEFGKRTNNLTDWDGYKVHKHGMLRTQCRYILVLDGHLRDRYFESAFKDFMKWLVRLSKRVSVTNILVSISDYNHRKLLSSAESFINMFEDPSWCNEDREPNWCEFLMWDRMKDSWYPMMLGYKYIDDPENDEEVDRRRRFMHGEDS